MNNRFTKMTTIAAGLIVAASASVIPAPAANASPVPTPAAVQVMVPAAAQSDSFAKQTLNIMNAERAKVKAPKVNWNQNVANVSQAWSNRLGVAMKSPSFSFANIHRPDAGASAIPKGATWYREIIAINSTPAQVVKWWMNSPGHKKAMLDKKANTIGIGYVVPTSGPYRGMKIVVSNLAAYPVKKAAAPVTNSAIAAKAKVSTRIIGAAVTRPIAGLRLGGMYQRHQRGAIYWTAKTGAKIVKGGIRAKWNALGSEKSRLGYPLTDEYSAGKGKIAQKYQGGIMTWTAKTGAKPSYYR